MEEEIIYLTIPFKKIWKKKPDGSRTASLGLKINDCKATVQDDENKTIGSVCGRLGGGYEIMLNNHENEYDVWATHQSIWNAYCEAIEKPELKID